MQPIGPDRNEFMKYLSKLARNSEILPLTYAAWNNIPQNTLDAIWDDIQAIAVCPRACKNNCMKSLDEKWRNWKSYLKRKFFTGKSKEEALANVPTRVQPEHWKILVQYWSLQEVQTIADQNKKNRAMHGPAHRTGRTPHAVIRQEMKEKGQDIDQLSVYIRTRMGPDGVPKDDEAATVIGQFREKLSQIPILEQTMEVRQRIFREVMGPECRGYVRTIGLGPSPSQYFGKTSSKHQLSDDYMTLILNKVEDFYEQKYGQKILDMQSQIDCLNARLQSNGCIMVPPTQMAYTKGVHQVQTTLDEHDQDKHLSQNLNSDNVHVVGTDMDEDNEDSV